MISNQFWVNHSVFLDDRSAGFSLHDCITITITRICTVYMRTKIQSVHCTGQLQYLIIFFLLSHADLDDVQLKYEPEGLPGHEQCRINC